MAVAAVTIGALGFAPSAAAARGAPDHGFHIGQQDEFSWSGRVATGDAIEVKGVNGDIRAEGYAGSEVQVEATKRWKKSDPESVRIEVLEHDDGVTICALYPSKRKPNECLPGDRGHLASHDNDVKVSFRVRVPDGVRFLGTTVNGSVKARGLTADCKVHTVNGGVEVVTAGIAEAGTVNGSVKAVIGRTDWTGTLNFSTVNGTIRVELPADVNAEVSAGTVNGHISSDFPLTVFGRFSPRSLRGTIGDGGDGRELKLNTVNGSILLVQR